MTNNPGAVIAAIKLRTESQIVRTLRQSDARSLARARPVDVHRPLGAAALRSLMRAGAIKQSAPDLFYLDEAAYKTMRREHGTLMAVLIAAALAIGLAAYIYATQIQS